jgi:hypothetical protein
MMESFLTSNPPSFNSFTAFSAPECCPNTAATELLELLGAVVRIMIIFLSNVGCEDRDR